MLVFACIVAHELGHALVARRFNCLTREIVLLPIGGIAQMQRIPHRPAQELLVALAGPEQGIVFVGDRETIIGILTADQLATYASLRQASVQARS